MDKVNIFNQMAQYDFSTPINITMIFEEDNDDDANIINVLNEQNQDKSNTSSQETINFLEELNTTTHAISPGGTIISVDLTNENRQQYLSYSNKTAQVYNGPKFPVTNVRSQEAEENVNGNICNTYQQKSDSTEPPDYVEHLLKTVTEHIILIMRPHYHYYFYNRVRNINIEKQLNKLKVHFFNLSYSTVASVILPQEKNEIFINKLIDKTVSDANKIFKWKCERRHVEPFYNEMIAWAKQKKEHIKTIGLSRFNEQCLIKEPLVNPSVQLRSSTGFSNNIDLMNNAHHSSNERSCDSEKKLCIFSSGEPGKEININISSEILINHYAKQSTKITKLNPLKNKNISRHSKPQNTQESPIEVPSVNLNQKNYFSKNNIGHYKTSMSQSPPPLYSNRSHITSSNILNNTEVSANWIQQNAMHNYPHPRPTFPYTAGRQQHYSQTEGQPLSPIITNATSQNSTILAQNGRCCVCDKFTTSLCLKCYKFSYCSALCQELDAGVHRTCGNQNN